MDWVGGKLDGIGLVWIMSERKFYKITFFMFSPVFLLPIADFSYMVVLGLTVLIVYFSSHSL